MVKKGRVISCHTVKEWNVQLEKGKESKILIVVDFFATWCWPCKHIAPALEKLAKGMPRVTFLKVDVDELKSVADEWEVRAMPTFLCFKDGRVVEKIVGANKEKLQEMILKHATEEE
ncbi:hypothetical protein Tsubulata_041655 [Turnera subulata]|uniref:Thioredoxin domain-containing protein n=1 Tax=Turnera subulata TaxID=218843 RepID=A0A9Q0JKE7_9ROSI|nr:hypothetical protein Tsubulata_041655 [Turnera subulata]